jgi:hypothetical protein
MAPLARPSIAARIRAHRSSAVRSPLSFLPGQHQPLGVLDGLQRLAHLEHRGVDLVAARQALGFAARAVDS